MNTWVFEIDGQPVGKGRPRFTRNGRVYTPERTRSYEEMVELSAYVSGLPVFDRGDALMVQIDAYFARPKKMRGESPRHIARPDADNIAKAILDGLKKHLRDELVAELSVSKTY